MCKKTNSEASQNSSEVISSENISSEAITAPKYIDVDGLQVELLNTNKYNSQISASDNNKFIGYIYLSEIKPTLHIGDVYLYEKYIVLEEFPQEERYGGGFNVYEYDNNINISEYKINGIKLYNSLNYISGPYYFKGIYNDLLFIDSGTGPGIRGIEIFDLANNSFVLDGAYYNGFSFYNNVVRGLVFTKWSISSGLLDDYIVDKYNEYLETMNKSEETDRFDFELILHYTYNILTHEINFGSGEYIFVQ